MTDPLPTVPPEAVTAIALIVPSPAELQEEIIRILRDHLTAAPPRSVDDDDLQVTAISIIDSVQDVYAATIRAQGMRHPRLSGNECPYLAPHRGRCDKCGWIDPAVYEDQEVSDG